MTGAGLLRLLTVRAVPAVLTLSTLLLWPIPARAQVRVFADIGTKTFAATRSFETILGRATGVVLGGGVQADIWQNVFVSLRASRFRKTGQRVFVFEGQQFNLGIPTTITVTPLELTGGYRVIRPGWRAVPYVGGGIGWHRYEESSSFADSGENVQQWFTGYHAVGGVELRLSQWVGLAGEAQWATVPDALGGDPNGVSREFRETDLGGATFRVKLVVGQ